MIRALVLGLGVVLALALAAAPAHAQQNRMGEVWDLAPGETPPVIELFTFGRGEVIFEKFGHTALCLNYHEPQRDTVCFNYGVTDFSTPPLTLIWSFIRGRQRFWVEPVPLGGMVHFYRTRTARSGARPCRCRPRRPAPSSASCSTASSRRTATTSTITSPTTARPACAT